LATWQRDEIDQWGNDWAHQRRVILGIVLPESTRLSERIGRVRSTLGQLTEMRDGSGRGTTRMQRWPEVYTGMSLVVHQIYQTMPFDMRLLMDLHYVWREIPIKEKLTELDCSRAQYFMDVASMKSFIYGAMLARKDAEIAA
jgi:hypothetical protein